MQRRMGRRRTSRFTVTSFGCSSLQLVHLTYAYNRTCQHATVHDRRNPYSEEELKVVRSRYEVGDILEFGFDREQ